MLPKMEILTPGKRNHCKKTGTVQSIEKDKIILDNGEFSISSKNLKYLKQTSVLPKSFSWQEVLVKHNEKYRKNNF